MKRAHGLVLAFGLLLAPASALPWYEKTHAWIFGQAIEVIQAEDAKAGLYEELYTGDFRFQLGRGAWREDFDPPVADSSRAMRHYYDPRAAGLAKGIAYAPYFDVWPYLDPAEKVARPKGQDAYDGALRWALDGGGLAENPFHWKGAIEAYGQGVQGARREAFYRLGHVLHLLGDMADVDHATNTVHPGSGKVLPDDVDKMLVGPTIDLLAAFVRNSTGNTAEASAVKAFLAPGKDAVRAAIRAGLRGVVPEFDRPGKVRLTGYEGFVEDSVPRELVREFFHGEEFAHLKPTGELPALPGPEAGRAAPPGHTEFPQFFNALAEFAKAQRPPSLPLAIGCRDVRPTLLALVEALFPSNPAVAQALAHTSYFREPVYLLPLINENDAAEYAAYLDCSKRVLPEAVAYTVALLRHFHDLVNEPPFVEEVTVRQSEQRAYHAAWQVGGEGAVETPTGRAAETYYEVAIDADSIPHSYLAAGGRRLVPRPGRPLLTGKRADVRIVFGPVVSAGERTIAERIDPRSVVVQIDGQPVQGHMENANTWVAEFTPELAAGVEQKTMALSIEARDLHRHLLPGDAPDRGYRLDSDPATMARVEVQTPDFSEPDAHRTAPRYRWTGFEGGVDRRHAFQVARADTPEPARGPHCSIAPSATVVLVSGSFEPQRIAKERERWEGELAVEAPEVTYRLEADGTAVVAPNRIEVRLEHLPGQNRGWREVWAATLQPGKGDIRSSKGAGQVEGLRESWNLLRGELQVQTTRTDPTAIEWIVGDDGNGAYRLYLSSTWGPPTFLLTSAARPETPEVLVAQYLAWFDLGKGEFIEHKELERVDRELVARGKPLATAVASLCAARRASFLREQPTAADREFSLKMVLLARRHLELAGQEHVQRGEYILQAIAASSMNRWGDKGLIAAWGDAALDRGVRVAPEFFPDTGGGADYAGGIDLLGGGQSKVSTLKKKYRDQLREPLFEGW